MDILHKVLKWADHNRYVCLGILLAVVASVWLFGCQITTPSLTDPAEKVTAQQFEVQVVTEQAALEFKAEDLKNDLEKHNKAVLAFNQRVELGRADIEAQIELRENIVSIIGGLATSAAEGTLTPGAAINSIITLGMLLAGGGAILDNRRKNKVIAELKTK